ncbi:23S rRNA pseudouridine(2604) synthase RluF [Pseudoalteromonas maricaloris]|uniref:23S rRNA pseudouridine(2604) synthase RluF n=1 Tax=Pseudoalteromonas maricaloris TaxID=184924 RepID=UPI0021ADBF30|nr:23S rRNA pseudouridine(2604) synthase RluF [Pseudoalteromonas flavipulchra]USE71469.1 23S rRNA pseudouridine(2604) synthase RluF [Pseudoalteromonas flavipulchra]
MTEQKRLNKYISETGFCSRREADDLIASGRVKVNGILPEMGTKVSDADTIIIDGKPLKAKPKAVFIAYNKPVGVTCTTERKIRSNIVSAINYPERIFPIGRLDRPSEGLIFLTNQGDMVNKILRAGNNHEKEYEVVVDRPIDERFVKRMSSGVPILGTVTKPCKVRKTGAKSFTIVLTQGLNRQIRRMCEYLGFEVTHLKRIRIMNIDLTGLSSGKWRHLNENEMRAINHATESSSKTQEASAGAGAGKQHDKPRSEVSEVGRPKQDRRAHNSKDRTTELDKQNSVKPKPKTRNGEQNHSHNKRKSSPKPNAKPAKRVKGTLSLNKNK